MKKDNKKALYENIMTSVAKEVKKALNEGEELSDKQARLDQLMQEYNKIYSKIDNIEDDFHKKLFKISRNSKEYFAALDNHYKSLKPLEDELYNKFTEITNLKKEIAASKQTINQPKINNHQKVQNVNTQHKFVVFRGNTKYGDYSDFIDEDYPVFAYVYDANESFLPDYTPDWLYKIMDQIQAKTKSSYIEHQESMFGMDEKFYNALINDPACAYNGVVTEDEEENIDEILSDNFENDFNDYDEDEENNNYDEEEIKEKLSNIILNPYFNVKAGGRFAPIGGKDKLDLLGDNDLHEMLQDDPKLAQVRKDIKYDVDLENGYIDHRGTTKDGIDYLALLVNGDWEEPVALFVYWDGKKYRGYVPTRGNAINTINRSAFGNDEDADNEYCTKYLGLKDYYGCDGCAFGLPINWDVCLEEFETRLVVK